MMRWIERNCPFHHIHKKQRNLHLTHNIWNSAHILNVNFETQFPIIQILEGISDLFTMTRYSNFTEYILFTNMTLFKFCRVLLKSFLCYTFSQRNKYYIALNPQFFIFESPFYTFSVYHIKVEDWVIYTVYIKHKI